jgi:hypothetical protein
VRGDDAVADFNEAVGFRWAFESCGSDDAVTDEREDRNEPGTPEGLFGMIVNEAGHPVDGIGVPVEWWPVGRDRTVDGESKLVL